MKQHLLVTIGIAEVGALIALWRSAKAAPFVEHELDVTLTAPPIARARTGTASDTWRSGRMSA